MHNYTLSNDIKEELLTFWNSASPVLPPYLAHTLLIWIPCGVFWLLSPLEVISLINGRSKRELEKRGTSKLIKFLPTEARRRRRFLFFARLVALLLMLVSSLFRLASSGQTENAASGPVLSAFILYPITVAFLMATTVFRYWRLLGPPSPYSWLTLCAFCLAGLPEVTFAHVIKATPIASVIALSFYVQYASTIVALVLFSLSDHVIEKETRTWPESVVSFPNALVFWWFLGLLIKGYRRVLSLGDMFTVSEDEQTSRVYETFDRHLRAYFGEKRLNKTIKENEPGLWAMYMVIARTFWKPVMAAAVLYLINTILIFMSPVVTVWLMQLVRDETEPLWHGLTYVGVLFSATLIRNLAQQYHMHLMNKFGVRARAAVVAAVYRKSLTMSSEARRVSNTGEIVNLMAVDSTRFIDLAPWLQLLWAAPVQVTIGLYFIYTSVGHAVWSGVAVMAAIFTVTSVVSQQMGKFQMKQLHEKDRRMKLLTEMLNGMKVVKLYAWETAFQRLIERIRAMELRAIKLGYYLFGAVEVSFCCTHLLSCIAIFGTHCLINPPHNLTPEVAFFVLSVFNIIYIPFTQLPMAVSYTVMTLASVSRLSTFFRSSDLVPYVECSAAAHGSIEIQKASFAWDSDGKEPILKDISMTVKPGQLMAIIGPVASGKSSLINAVCGEMKKISGSICVNGTIAYVAQQAWIQNLTVRDNILFGSPYDERRYQKIVQACQLKPDFALLERGDMTSIGERGSNLSGGQKQRMSMARAVYQDADIYLLDDPLSAVDVHVGRSIFDAVIGPNGLLKEKARLFVTHGINYLPLCDYIALMNNGKILTIESHKDIKRKEALAGFVEPRSTLAPEDPCLAAEKTSLKAPNSLLRAPSRQNTFGSIGSVWSDMVLERLSSFRQSHVSKFSDMQNNPVTSVDDGEDELEDAEEEVQTGKIGWKTYWLYARYSGVELLMYAIFMFLSEFSYMGASMWLEHWTDTVPVNRNGTVDSDVVSGEEGIGVLGGFAASQLITTIIFALYFVWFLVKASTRIHETLLMKILRSPMSFFDTTPIGRVNNRFGKDMNTIDNQIPSSFKAIIQFFIIIVSFFIPVAYGTPMALTIVVPLLIVYYFLQKFYVASSRQFRRLEAVTRSPIYSHFQETINGIATIRAYRQEQRFSDESDRLVDVNDSVQMTLLASNRWFGINLDFIGNLLVLGSSLSAVLTRGKVLPGSVGLSISYSLGITDILSWGVREMSMLETEVVALERVKEYMDIKPEAEWTSAGNAVAPTAGTWPSKGAIEFRDYSTTYRPGLPLVLRDFQCRISAGEKVGVIGRTGAGKSSLTLALFRLIEPVHGTVIVDGVDISSLGLHDLRRNLTIIPQEPVLFSGTLRQNIDPFDQYTDAELYRALDLSHLNSFVATLSGGLGHEISEGGANLSVGQRQLLCLARALLKKTKVLVLDEATASVDVETDTLIQKTVREQFAECTVICIAHRLNAILDCDRVMVLDAGRLTEFDTPRALMEDENSEFGKMIKEAGINVHIEEPAAVTVKF